MLKHVSALALSLALSVPVLGASNDVGFFFTKERAEKLRAEMKTNPVNVDLVQKNLQKIVAGVHAAQPEKIQELQLTVDDQQGLVSNFFAINLMAKSPFFEKLALKAYAKDDRSAIFYNVDTIGIGGSVTVDSHGTLKALLLENLQREGKPPAQALIDRKAECGNGTIDLKKEDAFSRLECIMELSLLSTDNFSEWLVQIDAPVKALAAAAKKALRDRVGRFDSLTFMNAYTCNKTSYFCRGEYLYGYLSSYGLGTSSVGFEFTITANELKFDLNVTARRQLVDLLQGTFTGSVSGMDLIRYVAMKELEKMDENEIKNTSDMIAQIIEDSVKLAKKKNNKVELKNP